MRNETCELRNEQINEIDSTNKYEKKVRDENKMRREK